MFCVNNYTAGPDYSISLGILVDAAVIMSVSTLQRDTAFQARSLVCFFVASGDRMLALDVIERVTHWLTRSNR